MKTVARPAYRLYSWLWSSLDWVYPPICGGCGGRGVRWCKICQENANKINPPVCEVCGIPNHKGGRCLRCTTTPPKYRALRSWAEFNGPVRNALHRLKYKRDIALGEALSRSLMRLLTDLDWNVNLVLPVPLSRERLLARGYNQAGYLAKPLALAQGLSYVPEGLLKTRDTASQVKLTLEERRRNVYAAFLARGEIVAGKTILLIDDVATSGATLDSCTEALLKASALDVYCLTLARAV